MICLCPSCHANVTRGALPISDDTLYEWKTILRDRPPDPSPIFVEAGSDAKLLLGSIAVTGNGGLIVFDLSPSSRLSLTIKDGDIFLINLAISDTTRRELVPIVDGHVRVRDPGIDLEHRTGLVRVTAQPGLAHL